MQTMRTADPTDSSKGIAFFSGLYAKFYYIYYQPRLVVVNNCVIKVPSFRGLHTYFRVISDGEHFARAILYVFVVSCEEPTPSAGSVVIMQQVGATTI